jgi:hypothetical protein
MGGSSAADTLENGNPLCWRDNDLIERDPVLAEEARRLGVKVSRHSDPSSVPIWSPAYVQWAVYAVGSMFLTGERDSGLDARDLLVSGDRVAGFRVSVVNRSADQVIGAGR